MFQHTCGHKWKCSSENYFFDIIDNNEKCNSGKASMSVLDAHVWSHTRINTLCAHEIIFEQNPQQ
jgi:hypothetical protein